MIPGSVEGDIYSFGIILQELDQRMEPFAESELASNGISEPPGVKHQYKDCLSQMWDSHFKDKAVWYIPIPPNSIDTCGND